MTTLRRLQAAALAAGLAAIAPQASADAIQYSFQSLGSHPSGGFATGVHQTPTAGDDRLFVVARNGRVHIREGGSYLPQPLLDISSLTTTTGERGLLGFAFHPEFGSSSRFVFAHHTNLAGDTVLARYEVRESTPNTADPASRRELMVVAQDASNHNGGAIAFGPDGYLYIALGDGGGSNDPNCRSQDNSSPLGTILRIDVDQSVDAAPWHGIPAGNPFTADPAVPDAIWATGLRNPWRISFDMQDGDLWIADVGQSAWEEVNRLDPFTDGGANLGWPVKEGFSCNGATGVFGPACAAAGVALPPCSDPTLVDPVHVYPNTDNCSITGGFVYRGSAMPSLSGLYIFGDFCSGRVWSIDPADPANRTLLAQVPSGFSLTTFGQDRAGEIYLNSGAEILLLVSDEEPSRVPDWRGFEPR